MYNEKKSQLNINIDARLLKSLKLKSIIEDKTLSEFIINILESYEKDNDIKTDLYQKKIAELDSRLLNIEQKINTRN